MLVMAAGMGSRYGGLKQLDPVGPNGEVLLDYSVYDAARAGFKNFVFLIRKEFEAEFKDKILRRFPSGLDTKLAYQGLDDLPSGLERKVERSKPWGTAHAVWCARQLINSPFLVINGDDFYGRNSYVIMNRMLEAVSQNEKQGCMVAFTLFNTLSNFGGVTRGVCKLAHNAKLRFIEECFEIQKSTDGVITGRTSSGALRTFSENDPVSMNFWGFHPAIFPKLENLLRDFFVSPVSLDPKAELYLPEAVKQLIESEHLEVHVEQTDEQWMGVTYREDKPLVVLKLAELHSLGYYPEKLWS